MIDDNFSKEAASEVVQVGLLGPPTKFTTLSPKNAAESIW